MSKRNGVLLLAFVILLVICVIVNQLLFVYIGNEKYSIFSKKIIIYPDKSTYYAEINTPLDLSQLERCKRLDTLYVARPCDLSVLNKLEGIDEFGIRSPAVIDDYSPLSSLVNLKYCYIDDNEFKDVDLLQDMTLLETLVISNTSVCDISVLSELTNLSILNISNTNVGDISLIQHMPKLCEVYLSGCPISDYRVLIACKNLKTLHVYQDQLPYDIKEELEKKGISIMLEMPN